MSYSGHCACGSVTLAMRAKPVGVRQCWCRQCQRVAAGGATHNAIFAEADVVIDGLLGSHAYTAPSGNTLTQWFCAACGSPVATQSSARTHLRSIRLGVIDQPHDLRPQEVIWTGDAPQWALFDPELPQYPGQPPVLAPVPVLVLAPAKA